MFCVMWDDHVLTDDVMTDDQQVCVAFKGN